MKEIGIALLGLGNVGLGTYRILNQHAKDIERRLGARVRVRHVLVRDAIPRLAKGTFAGHMRLPPEPHPQEIDRAVRGNPEQGAALNAQLGYSAHAGPPPRMT